MCIRKEYGVIEFKFNFALIRQWTVFLAKILLKSDQACANTIIFAAIDFSLQNISGVYLS